MWKQKLQTKLIFYLRPYFREFYKHNVSFRFTSFFEEADVNEELHLYQLTKKKKKKLILFLLLLDCSVMV